MLLLAPLLFRCQVSSKNKLSQQIVNLLCTQVYHYTFFTIFEVPMNFYQPSQHVWRHDATSQYVDTFLVPYVLYSKVFYVYTSSFPFSTHLRSITHPLACIILATGHRASVCSARILSCSSVTCIPFLKYTFIVPEIYCNLAGIVGSIQANETIKIITGLGKPLSNQLLLLDTLEMSFRKIKITSDTKRQKPTSLIDYDVFCGITSNSGIEISPEEFIEMKSQNDSFTLIDIREEYEHEAFNIGGINIPMEEVLERIGTFSGKIVFYCSSGQRAKAIANKLRKCHNEDRFYAL